MKLLFLSLLAVVSLYSQSLATVNGILKNADGTAFSGKVTIIVSPLESVGVSVRSAPINLCSTAAAACPATIVNGVISVQLTANDITYPLGTPYYTVYQPTRGTPYSEYWGVNEGGPWTIKQVLQVTAPTPGTTINTLLNGTATPPGNGLGNNGRLLPPTPQHTASTGAKASSV